MDNYIYAYYQKITDGSIVVGKWVRLLYEMIITGIEDGTYIFDQQKANRAIRFIETFCRHNKGKLAPGRLILSLAKGGYILYIRHTGQKRETPVQRDSVVCRKKVRQDLTGGISDGI